MALLLVCAAGAQAAPVAPRTAVLGADDVAGLAVGSASAAPWLGLVGRHAASGSRAATTVLRSGGNPRLLIVSRALVARDAAHAKAFKRALGAAGRTAANRVDARALGVPASTLRNAQRTVWRDGPVVGELMTVGAAKGDPLLASLQEKVRDTCAPHGPADAMGRAARTRRRPRRAPRRRDGVAGLLARGGAPARGARAEGPARLDPGGDAGHELGPRQLRTPDARRAPGRRSRAQARLRPLGWGGGSRGATRGRQGPGHRLRRPARRRRAHASGHHRPRLPVERQGRRGARASTRAAATGRPSPRRAASSASGAAALRRPSSRTRSSIACRSSSPAAPAACSRSTATGHGWGRAARPTPAACSLRTERHRTARPTPATSSSR